MENTKQKRIVHKLSSKQVYEVTNIVKEEYVKKAVSDVEFAKYLTAKLGYHVTESSIATSRDILDIVATRDAKSTTFTSAEVNKVISDLCARVKVLEDRFNVFTLGNRG